MQQQLKPLTGNRFFRPTLQKPRIEALPKIVWKIPPPDFEIPDDPMDNFDQSLLAEALREALSCTQRLSEYQLCATSLAVCVNVGGRTITKAPDWVYVPQVHPTDQNRHSYTPNVEGQLPTIVMEFLSDQKGKEYDESRIYPYGKWYFYEQILKVPNYVIFNPENGKLEVYYLKHGHYQKQTSDSKGFYWIESMKLFLGVWEGFKEDVKRRTFWLRWWDAEGNQLPWQSEQLKTERRKAELAEIEKQKALETAAFEKRKAEMERRKAEQAEMEKQKALETAEIEKQKALKTKTRQMAKQMLQAQVEMTLIQQITGLDEAEINALRFDKNL
jgi:Uma2 family endonuclease